MSNDIELVLRPVQYDQGHHATGLHITFHQSQEECSLILFKENYASLVCHFKFIFMFVSMNHTRM